MRICRMYCKKVSHRNLLWHCLRTSNACQLIGPGEWALRGGGTRASKRAMGIGIDKPKLTFFASARSVPSCAVRPTFCSKHVLLHWGQLQLQAVAYNYAVPSSLQAISRLTFYFVQDIRSYQAAVKCNADNDETLVRSEYIQTCTMTLAPRTGRCRTSRKNRIESRCWWLSNICSLDELICTVVSGYADTLRTKGNGRYIRRIFCHRSGMAQLLAGLLRQGNPHLGHQIDQATHVWYRASRSRQSRTSFPGRNKEMVQ